jgi:tetrahydromethanopterin S-methyltransferase subunit B
MTPVRAETADGVLGEKVRQLEERGDKWDAAIGELVRATAETRADVAHIRGSIDGAFRAKKISGALLGVLVSVGASALLGLLLFALNALKGGG